MIYERKCFSATCDGCKEDFEDGGRGWSMFQDKSVISEMMGNSEWYITSDNKTYCPSCHSINDDDELILKCKAAITD